MTYKLTPLHPKILRDLKHWLKPHKVMTITLLAKAFPSVPTRILARNMTLLGFPHITQLVLWGKNATCRSRAKYSMREVGNLLGAKGGFDPTRHALARLSKEERAKDDPPPQPQYTPKQIKDCPLLAIPYITTPLGSFGEGGKSRNTGAVRVAKIDILETEYKLHADVSGRWVV